MSNELRSFPLSDSKREKLYKSGIFPFTKDITVLAAIIFIVLSAGQAFNYFSGQISSFAVESADTAFNIKPENAPEVLRDFWKLTANLTLVILAPFALAILLANAIQTRFLLALNLLKFDMRRFVDSEKQGFLHKLVLSITSVLKSGAWVFLVIVLFYGVFSEWTLIISQGVMSQRSMSSSNEASNIVSMPTLFDGWNFSEEIIIELNTWKKQVTPLFIVAILFALLIAVLSRFLVVLDFERKHRMTRAEVEAEYREQEAPKVVLRARKELQYGDE